MKKITLLGFLLAGLAGCITDPVTDFVDRRTACYDTTRVIGKDSLRLEIRKVRCR